MSILDNNAAEHINEDVENAAKITAAKQPIINTFRNAFLALNHAQHIQKWLYDHSIYQTQYEAESLGEYSKSQNIDWEAERAACLQLPIRIESHYFENENFIYLPKNGFHLVPVVQKSNFSQHNVSYGEVKYEMMTLEVYTPQPMITKYATSDLDVYSQTTLTYPTLATRTQGGASNGGATLFLRDVDYIPSVIAEKDDNGFYHWIMPIKNIYLCDCPNIPQDILDLPYVHTFEEMGWLYWKY